MNASLASRRAYAFQWRLQKLSPHLRRDRPMAELQRLTAYVWSAERSTLPMPRVVAGDGWRHPVWGLTSYCDTNLRRIVLCRDNRNIGVLIHELAHALGPWDKVIHGQAFLARQFRLLETYGSVDPIDLLTAGVTTL